jgi:hypothetical protein
MIIILIIIVNMESILVIAEIGLKNYAKLRVWAKSLLVQG